MGGIAISMALEETGSVCLETFPVSGVLLTRIKPDQPHDIQRNLRQSSCLLMRCSKLFRGDLVSDLDLQRKHTRSVERRERSVQR